MSCFYKCNKYQIKKYETRQEAIEWQTESNQKNFSYEELSKFNDYFYKKGKRYGLLREFKENGII